MKAGKWYGSKIRNEIGKAGRYIISDVFVVSWGIDGTSSRRICGTVTYIKIASIHTTSGIKNGFGL